MTRTGRVLGWTLAVAFLLVAAALLVQLSRGDVSLSLPPLANPFAAPTPSSTSPFCANRNPNIGVYHPDRLVFRNSCATVTGIVELVRPEADGDFHIRLRLDPGQAKYVNARNDSEQQGDMILEIVCVNRITQLDAEAACAAAPQEVRLTPPHVGQHIAATGPFVLDSAHGWLEIHPLYGWDPQ